MRLFWTVFLVLLAVGLALWFAGHHESTTDWHACYEPATRHMLAGESPYRTGCFYNPPWITVIQAPFVALGRAGFAVWLFVTLIGLAVAARYCGAAWWIVPLVWLSPPVISLLRQGQIDWLVYLGVIVPPWIGAFLVLLKPQVGIGLAALLTVRVWRRGGIVRVVGIWLLPGLLLLASFALYGNWLARGAAMSGTDWNVSPWPKGIPLGVVLVLLALRYESMPAALIAGPLLAPYYNYFSLTGVVLAFVRQKWLMFLLIGLPWLIISLSFVTRLVLS